MPLRKLLMLALVALFVTSLSVPGVQAAEANPSPESAAAAIVEGTPVDAPPEQPVPTKPKRSEIPAQYTWNLESIYATDQIWEADFQALRNMVPQLEDFKGTLGQSAGRLLEFFKLQDETGKKLGRLYVFAAMKRDEDTSNSRYQGLVGRVESFSSSASQATAFVTPELVALPEEQLRGFIDQEPGLEPYRHMIEGLIRQKAHVRSTEVEEILAQTGEISRTAQDTFSVLTNADMKFPSITDENGQSVEITNANYGRFIISPDRRVRKEAWDALTGTYGQFRNALGATLAGSTRGDAFGARVRGFSSSLEASLSGDNLPVDVYHSLLKAVNENLPLLHRYMAIRKEIMGLDELHMYDRYAPLLPSIDFKMTYDEAVDTVLAALAPMGQEYVEIARKGLASRWVDVYETEGKRSGAYSWGSYTTQPFILMNFQGNLDDVYTLAHEMGHAMHSYYMRGSQPYIYGSPSIFTAETASNVHETLLTDYLIKQATDPAVRTYLINKEIDAFQGTFFVQAMFAEFELETHRRAEAGEELTPDALSRIWTDLGAKYYGPGVVIDEGYSTGWSRIPHFYNAFYVYQYSTGLAGASALAQQIVTEGQPAAQRYIEFLKSGSSDYPLPLLQRAGVDMSSPDPVNRALQRFEDLLNRLEEGTRQAKGS